MSNAFNKKINDLLGKMDEKVVKKKLNTALNMINKGNSEELARKIKNVDKTELLEKIDEFDKEKVNELDINLDEIRNKISDSDLSRISRLIGEQGDEIVDKIKKLIE